MQYRVGICCKCSPDVEVMIVKRHPSGNYCTYHNHQRLNEHKEKNSDNKGSGSNISAQSGRIPRKKYVYKRKATGEWAFFQSQFAVSNKRSFISDIPLIGELQPIWCFHVLGKGAFVKFRLYDKNLVFTTAEEHIDWHSNMTRAMLLKKDSRWQKIFDLYDKLKIEYENG